MALKLVQVHYSERQPATGSYLKLLGHRNHLRGISPELFAKFGDCLLQTLQRFHGAEWNSTLEQQWREAIEQATAMMLEGYREPQLY